MFSWSLFKRTIQLHASNRSNIITKVFIQRATVSFSTISKFFVCQGVLLNLATAQLQIMIQTCESNSTTFYCIFFLLVGLVINTVGYQFSQNFKLLQTFLFYLREILVRLTNFTMLIDSKYLCSHLMQYVMILSFRIKQLNYLSIYHANIIII